jgi:hypothetical protein
MAAPKNPFADLAQVFPWAVERIVTDIWRLRSRLITIRRAAAFIAQTTKSAGPERVFQLRAMRGIKRRRAHARLLNAIESATDIANRLGRNPGVQCIIVSSAVDDFLCAVERYDIDTDGCDQRLRKLKAEIDELRRIIRRRE